MACGSGGCSSGGCSSGGCSSGGCNRMNVHDWLSGVSMPGDPFDVIEIKFKGGRKDYYRNPNNLQLFTGDAVVVEASPGHHIGHVSAQGEIVRLQMKKRKISYDDDLKIIYRKVAERDHDKWESSKNRENPTMYRGREIIQDHNLKMKLSDVEYQADNTKATFYYSAEERVDFRELIKSLAGEFRIRVEMRQISLRQEAGRLGGIGSCGRELCCSTWLTDFKSVSTSAARYQNLSLNPSKLSGQCGRLKCCLNYELETYMDALKDIPKLKKLKTEAGDAILQKTDIFKRIMWFSYPDDNDWHALPIDRVKDVLTLNAKGEVPHSLELDELEIIPEQTINSDIVILDKKYKKKGSQVEKKKKPKNQRNKNKTPQNKNKGSEASNRRPTNSPKHKTKKDNRPQDNSPVISDKLVQKNKPKKRVASKTKGGKSEASRPKREDVKLNQENNTSEEVSKKPRQVKSRFKKRKNKDE